MEKILRFMENQGEMLEAELIEVEDYKGWRQQCLW